MGSLSREALQIAWQASGQGMVCALHVLTRNTGIDSPALLSSPFILVTLASFGHQRAYQITPEDRAG